jgi:hypothetical protein
MTTPAALETWPCSCRPAAPGGEACDRSGPGAACKRAAYRFFGARSLGLSVAQWDGRLALLHGRLEPVRP